MRELVQYISSPGDVPTVVRCAMAHYQFEAIHPFADGNGRVGRALVLLMLHAEDVLPVPLLNPSAQLERRRREYYDHLLGVSRRGDWAAWIEFFTTCVADEAEAACRLVIAVDELRDRYRAQLSTARTSAALLRLVDELFAEPAITLRTASEVLDTTRTHAQRMIEKLGAMNILREVTGRRRNRVYVAQEVVDLFSTDTKADE